MSEQSAAWEYKEESPLREAWKMYLQNRAAVLGLVLLGAVLLLTPASVTTGMSAFFKACLYTTVRSLRPLARAVRM